MGDPKAFLHIPRREAGYRPVHERVADFGEVEQTLNSSDRKLQASRCMDCGVPFCHWPALWATGRRNSRTLSSRADGKRLTKFSVLPTIFPNLPDASVLRCAKRAACLNSVWTNRSPYARTSVP